MSAVMHGTAPLPRWRRIVAEEIGNVIGFVWNTGLSQRTKEVIDRELSAAAQRMASDCSRRTATIAEDT
jgi:hypothetical protein